MSLHPGLNLFIDFHSPRFQKRILSVQNIHPKNCSKMSTPEIKDPRFATTLAKGISILRAFKPHDNGLTNLELSRKTGLPKSSVSRLTFTLQALGYLSHSSRDNRYRLGPAVVALGNIASASMSFSSLAESIMPNLANDTRCLVAMGVRDQGKVLLVKTWRPERVSSLWLDAGFRLPLAKSSHGQAIMAAYSDDEFDKLLDSLNLDFDQNALQTLRTQTKNQLSDRGFYIAPTEHRFTDRINAVSVPFRSLDLDDPVVFLCSGEPHQLSEERMVIEVGPKLRDAVQLIYKSSGMGMRSAFDEFYGD